MQQLTTMVVEIETLKRRVEVADELGQLQRAIRAALAELRRLLYDLRDEPALDREFVESLGDLLAEFRTRSGIDGELVVLSWPGVLPYQAALHLRRIVNEALTNARRHSGASRVTVTLQTVGGVLLVKVVDDGRGMENAEGACGFGVRGMRERVGLLGGHLSVTGTPGGGTTIHCMIPLTRRP